jgi:hypothetical protein
MKIENVFRIKHDLELGLNYWSFIKEIESSSSYLISDESFNIFLLGRILQGKKVPDQS